jgi:hypothetical protein
VVRRARTSARASGPTGVAIGGGCYSISAAVRKKVRQSIENGPLHVGGRNAGDGPSLALTPFGDGSRDVVAIAHPVLNREARHHAVPAIVKQLSDQESLRSGASVAY